MEVKVKKLKESAVLPQFGSVYAAGADLYSAEDTPVLIKPGQTQFIHTGLAIEIPEGYVGLIYARSGLSCKDGLAPANKVGVIDSDFRGEIMIALHNHNDPALSQMKSIEPGERVAQMIITPYPKIDYIEADTLSETKRADGGFGSTGKKNFKFEV